LMMVFDEER